jgi:hypothetical protein
VSYLKGRTQAMNVCELRSIFGPEMEEVTGGWSQMHNGEPHNLYSLNIIRVIKPRNVKCMVCAVLMRKEDTTLNAQA